MCVVPCRGDTLCPFMLLCGLCKTKVALHAACQHIIEPVLGKELWDFLRLWCGVNLLLLFQKNIAGNYILTVICDTLGSCLLTVDLLAFADVKDM